MASTGLSYTLINNDTEYEVSGKGSCSDDVIIIPDTYNGKPVTSIGEEAFSKRYFQAVEIPKSVKRIGDSAFKLCPTLSRVTFTTDSALISIGASAFMECEKLADITIPNSVISIGDGALAYCYKLQCNIEGNLKYLGNESNPYLYLEGPQYLTIESATINSSCRFIGSHAFVYCDDLTSITIPNSITSIGDHAFYDCKSLTSIVIPASVTSIGSYAFNNCNLLTSIAIPEGVTSIGDRVFGGCSKLTSIEIPNSVTSIGSSAFYFCTSLKTIEIPASVTSIGNQAFYYCTSLTSVTFEETSQLTSIGYQTFYNCNSLKTLEIPASVINIGKEAFIYSGLSRTEEDGLVYLTVNDNKYCILASSKSASLSSNTTININTKYIMPAAFTGCTSLKRIEIQKNVISIGEEAFYECTNLEVVVIQSSKIISIGSKTFYNCKALTSITTLNSVTSIGNDAFYNCNSLTTAPFGKNSQLKHIGASAFYYCESLTSITIPEGVTSIGDFAFLRCHSLTQINFNAKDCADLRSSSRVFEEAGKNGTGITVTFGENIEKVIKIPAYLFYQGSGIYYAPKITNVIIGKCVTGIGNYAFEYCPALTNVTFEKGSQLTSVGEHAFENCIALKAIEIPASVTSIGNSVFKGCSSLTRMTLPFIGANKIKTALSGYDTVFGYIFGFKTSTSPSTISGATYQYCNGSGTEYYHYYIPTSIKSVTITGGESISYDAFYNCSWLTSIVIPNTITSIGNHAFYNCASLADIIIPNSVESIGTSVFEDCTSLVGVIIGDSVKGLDSDIFAGCNKLANVVMGSSVTSIGQQAFKDCNSLISVVIAEATTDIAPEAFSGCSSLISVVLQGETPPTVHDDSFSHTNENIKFYCYSESLTDYKNSWVHYKDNLIGDSLKVSFANSANAQKKYFTSRDEVRAKIAELVLRIKALDSSSSVDEDRLNSLVAYENDANWDAYLANLTGESLDVSFAYSADAQKKYFISQEEANAIIAELEARIAALASS